MPNPKHRFFKKKTVAGRPRSHVPKPGHSSSPPAPSRSNTPSSATFVDGVLQLKGKFGFVLSEQPNVGDVMVQGPSMRLAMNGDRVRARVTSPADAPRRSGEITEVLIH